MPICLSDCYPRRSRSTKHTVRPHADNGPPVARNHPRVIGAGGLGEFGLTRRALFFRAPCNRFALRSHCPWWDLGARLKITWSGLLLLAASCVKFRSVDPAPPPAKFGQRPHDDQTAR